MRVENKPKKQVRETKAGKLISAYLILKNGEEIATVHSYYGDTLLLDVYESGKGLVYQGRAGGCGYDKFTAALAGAEIDGHKLTDHSAKRVPLPKGKKLFPKSFKAPPGYGLANYGSEFEGMRVGRWLDEDSGKYVWSVELSQEEQDKTGKRSRPLTEEEIKRVKSGYYDCYRKSGFDYLKDFGYKVIQVL